MRNVTINRKKIRVTKNERGHFPFVQKIFEFDNPHDFDMGIPIKASIMF